MTDNAEKAQHLRRCFPHNIHYPRVACTIVWQPWAIKNATPTALFPTQYTLPPGSLHYCLATLGYQKRNTYGVETCIFRYDLFRLTT